MDRFERTLFDKLLDDDTPASVPSRAQWSLEQLKASVARDVEALLNTRMALGVARLNVWDQCKRSLLSYGLRDFSGLSLASHYDRHFICQSIEDAIALHEPRLHNVSVSIEADKRQANALHFSIRALLVIHPAAEPVDFSAMLQPSTLQYSVLRTSH